VNVNVQITVAAENLKFGQKHFAVVFAQKVLSVHQIRYSTKKLANANAFPNAAPNLPF
jgi:hypothetical protein